jgi:predicted O-methyltransferase YrrM
MSHSELFRTIEGWLKPLKEGGIDGWTSPEKGCELASIIIGLRPRVSVEIGTWCGRGAFSMAAAHRFIGHGKTYVIDPWSGAASGEGQEGVNAEWWGEQSKHDYAYKTFTYGMETLQLTEWIDVQRATSDHAKIPEGIGLAVIDGNHGPQAVKDVERWAPHVITGGVLYLDDMNWTGGAVAEAGKRAMSMGFTPLFQRDQGIFYQKTR